MKRIVILGSTGSIGKAALEVVACHPDKFVVAGLVAGKNIDLLEEQITKFRPAIVGVADKEAASRLRERLGPKPEIVGGEDGISFVAAGRDADIVLSALVGFSGLVPTLHAVRAGKVIGLANKEALVVAGTVVMEEAKKYGATILPVDSEHSAIFQCLDGRGKGDLSRIILTASGGPFFGKTREELGTVSPDSALRHPNWNMGRKITIDSATLMNKGLEVIEAHHLFGLPPERIDVMIHPQSIIHSLVEFTDGSMLAQMSVPDMKGPIAYALSYPLRLGNIMSRLDLTDVGKLTFQMPDRESFPCLDCAYEALREGGTMPAVLNAVNEVGVEAFLDSQIPFTGIPVIIKKTMDAHRTIHAPGLEAIIETDRWARKKAQAYLEEIRTGDHSP